MGAFLPGAPVANDEMEAVLGTVNGKPSRNRRRVLDRNGITSRYYALNREGGRDHTAFGMAAAAVKDALARGGIDTKTVQYLAAATTLSDVLVPGFASLVHGASGVGPCGIASFGGVCVAGVAAIQAAYAQVRAGIADTAVACASEFASRHLRGSILEKSGLVNDRGDIPFDVDFLR
jgi:3-oxoacyl-[acyl-carrier-protein] synthase-3